MMPATEKRTHQTLPSDVEVLGYNPRWNLQVAGSSMISRRPVLHSPCLTSLVTVDMVN